MRTTEIQGIVSNGNLLCGGLINLTDKLGRELFEYNSYLPVLEQWLSYTETCYDIPSLIRTYNRATIRYKHLCRRWEQPYTLFEEKNKTNIMLVEVSKQLSMQDWKGMSYKEFCSVATA